VAASFIADMLAFFFQSGPFSSRGIFVFWLALTTYSVFLIAMGLVMRTAVLRSADGATRRWSRPDLQQRAGPSPLRAF
jgi:hypothetical protein